MDNNVFSLLLLSGLFGISSHSQEFVYVTESKTWQDAQTYCRSTYADLATIENITQNNRAYDKVDLSYYGNVWLGLKKGEDIHWGWALGENTLSQYSMWAQNQPDNGFLDGHCGAIDQSNQWYAISCLYTSSFICYDDYDGLFHYYSSKLYTWKEAQSYCRNYHTDLASIRNSTEYNRVSNFILADNYVWLGLFADSWSWSDQSSTSFRHWAVDNKLPTLNYSVCAAMDMSNNYGLWYNLDCDTKLPFLCNKDDSSSVGAPFVLVTLESFISDHRTVSSSNNTEVFIATLKKRQIVEIKVNSDNSDLNDPLVMADILTRIDEKLGGKGNYSKLTWRVSDGKVFSPYVKKNSNATDEQ